MQTQERQELHSVFSVQRVVAYYLCRRLTLAEAKKIDFVEIASKLSVSHYLCTTTLFLLHLYIYLELIAVAPVYSCVPVYTHVYLCIRVYTCVYSCTPVYTRVYLCILMYTHVYLCILMYTCVHSCIPVYTCVYLHTPVCTHVYSCILVYTHVYPCILMGIPVYTRVYLCILYQVHCTLIELCIAYVRGYCVYQYTGEVVLIMDYSIK